LWVQVVLVPLVSLLALVALLSMHHIPTQGFKRRLIQGLGLVCLLLAVVVALGFGRVVSGRGPDIRFGPIPEGVPVNVIANLDPDAPVAMRLTALKSLRDFVLQHHRAKPGEKPGRKEFEERVAPALMNASKCPDFVMDRGHDYEFIRRLSDADKEALIQLLKTF
jgi:hypothetical protein